MIEKRLKVGIEIVDKAFNGGLPHSDLSCFTSPDDRIGSLVLGHYLAEGLKNGESVALITFDQAHIFMENFSFDGFKFSDYFKSGKFMYLNFQSSIRQKINFLQNYDELFEEIKILCSGAIPDRIAIHGSDVLLNMSNVQMAHVTAERLGAACKTKLTEKTTVLAHLTHYQDKSHRDLAIALEKVSAASFAVSHLEEEGPYEIKVRKAPWVYFDGSTYSVSEEELFKTLGIQKWSRSSARA